MTPMGNLESQINLMCMFLHCGRKPDYSDRTHADTGRTCQLQTETLTRLSILCSPMVVLHARGLKETH